MRAAGIPSVNREIRLSIHSLCFSTRLNRSGALTRSFIDTIIQGMGRKTSKNLVINARFIHAVCQRWGMEQKKIGMWTLVGTVLLCVVVLAGCTGVPLR